MVNSRYLCIFFQVGLSDTVTVEEYSVLYDHLLREMLPDCEMMPGAMRLVRHFAKHNIPMAICTGSCTFEYELKVQKHKELTDLIPLRVRINAVFSLEFAKFFEEMCPV